MEPDGQLRTPGTSYGSPPFGSDRDAANPTFLECNLVSHSPNLGDGLTSGKSLWDVSLEEGSEQSEDSQPAADLQRDSQKRFKSSAFSSSLSWDSDSEKETLNEEEQQNFSNPHGLAAHSPGSPSTGIRPDSEDDPECEKLQRFHADTPEEGHSDKNESTKTEEPNTCELGQKESAEGRRWNASEAFLSKVKPKEGCQMEEEEEEEEVDGSEGEATRAKGKESKELEKDVYTFPGDSDPESPPPAPWAHCTFIQRCRKKRVLLRPFSGFGTSRRTSPEAGKLATPGPQTLKTAEAAPLSPEVCNLEEAEGSAAKTTRESAEEEDGREESGTEIFTCVECSIYFKKQVHLQEHMMEHCQEGAGGGRRSGKGSRLQCSECGWTLPTRLSLMDHHRKHQESRLKILEEIDKLNEKEKVQDIQTQHPCSDPTVAQPTGKSNPGEMLEPELGGSLPLSPASIAAQDTDSAVIDLDAIPLSSGHSPAQARTTSGYRRRFVCTECSFSTKTSQALANHSKTHNRNKVPSLASGSLACGHCAFQTTSRTRLKEHLTVVHSEVSISGRRDDETRKSSRSNHRAQTSKDLYRLPDLKTRHDTAEGTAEEEMTADGAASGADRSCEGSRRSRAGGKTSTDVSGFDSEVDDDDDDDRLPGNGEEEQEDDRSGGFNSSQQEADSHVGGNLHSRADNSSRRQKATLTPAKQRIKKKDKEEAEPDRKVFFLRRRRNRISAASMQTESDYDDNDDERARCFLPEDMLDDDDDDDDDDALKSVEKKCPYCPDRFHNGIGLANHVRGHLNRVGVSYNVRHFISPEEVNEIEKKYSYQKKKKKVANFDPDTFSVMHCEFCSAGFDTRAGLSSHARAHLRDFGITNWDVTISPIHILRELFSSRPDLVIPTGPPRSCESSSEEEDGGDLDEDESDSEEGGIIRVKLEGETSDRSLSPSDSAHHQDLKTEEGEGDDEEAAEEEEEEEENLRFASLDGLSSSPRKDNSISPREDADTKVRSLKCEVCNSQFGSKRGLSIHARAHLRQLGITVAENSGPSIEILHKIVKERSIDAKFNKSLLKLSSTKNASLSAPLKDEELEDSDKKPLALSIMAKAAKPVPPPSISPTPTPSPCASPAPSHSGSPSSVVKKAPISSLLPVSSPLRSPEHKAGGIKSLTSNLSAASTITTAKPLWAPQENDAPLNLTLEADIDKDLVCQLCGAWFETRKGLSSHARAHLRHFGVEYSESKGSPIRLLNEFMDTEDFKHKASALELDSPTEPQSITGALSSSKQPLLKLSSSSSSSLIYKVTTAGGGSTSKATSSSASSLPGPPAKRLKTSSMQVFRLSSGELMAVPHSEPRKEIGCEYCGEYFENRKGLSSHARSHLRQMGITEWSVNGSPIDTLREVITRRGLPCALPLKPLKTPPPSSPIPPRSPLSATSSSSGSFLGRLPFAFARPSSPPQVAASKSSSAPVSSLSSLTLKPKPEPVQVEVTKPGVVGRSGGFPAESLGSSWGSSDNGCPLNLAMTSEVEPSRDIRCEFCGEYFENRKGLSSHARSHLRQMGITEWSVNGSPIDTLREVMKKRGRGSSSHLNQGVKKESTHRANSPSWDNTSSTGSSEGLSASSYQSSKFQKSPLNLVQSRSKFPKQGLGSVGLSAPQPAGKFFRMSPLGKRPLSEEAGGQRSVEMAQSPPHRLKTFSSLPHDFSFKRKPSPDKHAHQDPSCELCGFYFENRKALASHARAHLRQFGVTEWSVNGSPIETLSAWIRSRPQKVLEMHRNYMQGNRNTLKKQKAHSSSSSSSQWSSSLAVSLARSQNHKVSQSSSEMGENESGTSFRAAPIRPGHSSPGSSRLSGNLSLQAQVARSELNVRLPRGFERRPLKHPSCPDGAERDSGTPKPPRTGTIPALVPKPPSYPLVKLVGKFYTLKCRFCEVEFHGPLSVQEDWIRHLQQHILKMNYSKSAASKAAPAEPPTSADDPALAPTSRTTSTPTRSTAPSSRSPSPPAECAPAITATETEQVPEEKPAIMSTPIPVPPQIV